MKRYVKYVINYNLIKEICEKLNKKRINIFIDVQSISVGFYNKNTVLFEIGEYVQNGKEPYLFLQEMYEYLTDLFFKFKQFDPFFILFTDYGFNQQNKSINTAYKRGRSIKNLMLDDEYDQLFRKIKYYYFEQLKKFNKQDVCKVFHLKQYESDLIPHYCIMNNLFESNENDILNVILSKDKDLLQTCEFRNTIQCITTFKSTQLGRKLDIKVYDRDNAVSRFNSNIKRGLLTAKAVPLILAISGDKSDGIIGLKGYGPVKSAKLIAENNIPLDLDMLDVSYKTNKLPKILMDNYKVIRKNFLMTSFEEQIKRVPKTYLDG